MFTIGSNGKGRRRLSRTGEVVVGQAWAPKGNLIAELEGTCRVCVVPASLRLETVTANSARVHVLIRGRRSVFYGDLVWMPGGKRVLVTVEPH